jgi:hypothetical protein
MSYDLFLSFQPAIDQNDYLQYFANRRHFTIKGVDVAYENPDTGVYFFVDGKLGSGDLDRGHIVSASFNLNYFRPSFFGLEAEIEVTALINRFQPRIQDPQLDGMGEGTYSAKGFLRGWNRGNQFGIEAILGHSGSDQRAYTLPSCTLHRAWMWNYRRAERQEEVADIQFVPAICPVENRGDVGLAVAWGQAMPILLPAVDFVFVGRQENGAKLFGLVSWAEVVNVLGHAGVCVDCDPIDVRYKDIEAPPEIAKWVASVPAIDRSVVKGLEFGRIVDSELVAAATRK